MPSDLRIFGTFGPSCHTEGLLVRMITSGMNGIRLNTNHKKLRDAREWLEAWKSACTTCGIQGELLIDLEGRAVRTKMESPYLAREDSFFPASLLGSRELEESMKDGDEILIDDGLVILEVRNRMLHVLKEGLIEPRKSITLKGHLLQKETLSSRDRRELLEAGKYGVSSIMIPFVQSAADLRIVRDYLRENNLSFRIYAKIENQAGIDHLDEIIPLCDEIVIARGDLADGTSLLMIGAIQQQIINRCHETGHDYMIVTQMLHSMISHPRPTRAEVSDVFQAVYHGASSIMLTNETAAGHYPYEAMDAFCIIASSALEMRKAGS